jgi:hypothetical protein
MYTSVCTHTYTRARGGTRLHACTHRHMHIRTDTLTYTHVQVRTRTHRPTHAHTRTHTHTHTHTHAHTHTHTHARIPITVMNIDNNYTTSFAHICQALAVLDVEGRCAGCADLSECYAARLLRLPQWVSDEATMARYPGFSDCLGTLALHPSFL